MPRKFGWGLLTTKGIGDAIRVVDKIGTSKTIRRPPMTLEQQVEQFKYSRSRFYPSPKERIEFCEEFEALLQAFLDECCYELYQHHGLSRTSIEDFRNRFKWLKP